METPLQSIKQTGQLSDKELIGHIKGCHDNELSHYQLLFYNRYVNYVYKVASKKCRNYSDSEQLAIDITQETFIEVFEKIGEFNFAQETPESDHSYLVKGWLGTIANFKYLAVYRKYRSSASIESELRSRDQTVCPMCGELLIEDKKGYVCPKEHYRAKRDEIIPHEALSESFEDTDDLFESLFGNKTEIPNAFRTKLQEAMNSLSEKERHILLTYANEGCLGTRRHLSDVALQELCQTYNAVTDTIKHIKNRAYTKLKKSCLQ